MGITPPGIVNVAVLDDDESLLRSSAWHLRISWQFGEQYRELNYHVSSTALSIEGPMVGALYRW
jgi:hypothetical protein